MGALTRFLLDHPEYRVQLRSLDKGVMTRSAIVLDLVYPDAHIVVKEILTAEQASSDEYLPMVLNGLSTQAKILARERMDAVWDTGLEFKEDGDGGK